MEAKLLQKQKLFLILQNNSFGRFFPSDGEIIHGDRSWRKNISFHQLFKDTKGKKEEKYLGVQTKAF